MTLPNDRYTAQTHFRHDAKPRVGVLLINLGTPEKPTPDALRRYLREFLWDPRVVEIPRLLWWLILHGFVLRFRPARSAALYKKVWLGEGSPLRVLSEKLCTALAQELTLRNAHAPVVTLAMRYGEPSVKSALEKLRNANVQRMVVLPLYPQYASATTGSTFDAVADVLRTWRWVPELHFISGYHDHPAYIEAMAEQLRKHWNPSAQHLLFSFHGLPRHSLDAGDPYHCQCHATARLLAEKLKLKDGYWSVSFQSRFGRAEWLKPYTTDRLMRMAASGCGRVAVFCPGFAVDCVETLEEIAIQNAEAFTTAGGTELIYIPALNQNPRHVDALVSLVEERTSGWQTTTSTEAQLAARVRRASTLGAER